MHKRKEGEHFPVLSMFIDAYVNDIIAIACSIYDIRIVAKNYRDVPVHRCIIAGLVSGQH